MTPPVLHLYDDRLLYLDRYWREEKQVCDDLLALRVSKPTGDVPAFERLFPAGFEEQREAAEIALAQAVTVLTGGPGTGKTTTVARLLALLAEQAESASRLRIALAAPTGKAAARLQEAVQHEVAKLDAADRARLGELQAMTLHRLLGSRPDSSSRFRHDRGNRLPHDVIVVDETSMVSLTMMARLLEAVRPDARLVLVGDADQLASVEAGAVLADLVDGLSARTDVRVAALRTSHRFGEAIGFLAEAIRIGDADRALELLRSGDEHIEFIEDDDPTDPMRTILLPHALRLREAALFGADDVALATLDEHRLLCAHREGPYGVRHWNRQVEKWLSEETGQPPWSEWYPGRPLLVTANDYGLRRLQRRHRCGHRRRRRASGRHRRRRRAARLRDQPAIRRRDHARDDDPQIPGQPGRRGDSDHAAGGFAAADPGIVLYRGDSCEGKGACRRLGGVRRGRDRAAGGSCDRASAPLTAVTTQPWTG